MKTLKVVAALVVLLCAWGVSGGFAQPGTGRQFVTKWQGTKDEGLKIPIIGNYKIVIKDGSGNEKVNAMVTVADAENPYIFTPTEDGTYTIEAGPEGVKYMQMLVEEYEEHLISLTSNDKLLQVVQFGTVVWESMRNMFQQCKNMTFVDGIDTPDLSNVTSMYGMFFGCTSFNQSLNNWDVSNVTDMNGMFYGCSLFNQPLNNWNVSNVTNMYGLFYGCKVFNQPLDNWNVSNVTNMYGMFYGCKVFNQSLNNWDVSNVTSMGAMFMDCASFNQTLGNWNVSNVTDMSGMFYRCSLFNQPLGNWNVSNVSNMSGMFHGCSAFDQSLGAWKIQTEVGGLGTTAMSVDNYSKTLVGWANGTDVRDLVFNVNGRIYNSEAKAARQKLIERGWNFIGDRELSTFEVTLAAAHQR